MNCFGIGYISAWKIVFFRKKEGSFKGHTSSDFLKLNTERTWSYFFDAKQKDFSYTVLF